LADDVGAYCRRITGFSCRRLLRVTQQWVN
jgi:hypothetical protein